MTTAAKSRTDYECPDCFGTGRNRKGGPCQTCRATGRVGKVAVGWAGFTSLLKLGLVLTFVIVIAVTIISGSSSSKSHPAAKSAPAACIPDIAGTSKLCGSDAKDLCQTYQTGQAFDPNGVGAATVRGCAKLGVKVH